MYKKCLDNTHIPILPRLLSDSHVPLPTLYHHMHVFVYISHWFQWELSVWTWMRAWPLIWATYRMPHPGKNLAFHSPEAINSQNSFSARSRACESLLSPCWNIDWLDPVSICADNYSCCEVIVLFLRQVLLCSPGLSGTCQPFLSASWLVGLQACTTTFLHLLIQSSTHWFTSSFFSAVIQFSNFFFHSFPHLFLVFTHSFSFF